MNNILFKNSRDPLFGFTRKEILNHIKSSLKNRARAAYIYGSFARKDLHQNSDIDLFVITETDLPFPIRGSLFDDLRDRIPSLEILVYTPEEFAFLTERPSPGFWSSVVKEMVQVI